MIRLLNPARIEQEEIRRWAYDPDPAPPVNADANVWDLMTLEWFADDRLYADLASDESCPKRQVFLALLRQRLRRRSRRTRWLASTSEQILRGVAHSTGMRKRKGGGRKEAERVESREARKVSEDAEAEALRHGQTLLELVRERRQAEMRELAARLERFLEDPTSISDPYWDPPVT
jgi:hypothetical protein